MITSLRGQVAYLGENFLEVWCGPVCYKVFCPFKTLEAYSVGKEAEIFTHLHVREDELSLFGFQTREERDFFGILLGVSGVGPRGALGVLSAASLDLLKNAIGSGDISILTRVSGIGQKKAQRIILELRDKLSEGGYGEDEGLKDAGDVIEALIGLGYTRTQAQEALRKIPESIEGVEKKVKEALKILGK